MKYSDSKLFNDGYLNALRGRSVPEKSDRAYLAGYFKGQIQLNADNADDIVFWGDDTYVTKAQFVEKTIG